ncbi:type II secretion system inner membrane protein GspF [Alteromonas oceanisediminis]|uniref:type II secretion system inner membrane protein GspF n=1 Tax=Alteromonas oceanisediminis TaxID=2836180 RepID=UPI001BDAFCF4|nr:type II secretion system inner membrane protein GspF [Alteromonas oceanisediminis]MBT0587854.1 type II secretion system inner membrane protein GspF [Alteromonas oceanisediminis]
MPAYSYKALTQGGRNKSGVLEADNQRQVRQQLRDLALIPIEVSEVSEKAKANQKKTGFSLFKPRISAADLALLTRQLATLVESALPIEEALLAVAEQSEKPRHKNMMMAIRSKVVEGFALADALGEFPSVFDNLFRSMVAAGEKSGHLDTVLNRLADYTEQRNLVKNQITQAMIYPIIMLVVAIGIVSLLLTYVVPKIIGQFDNMGQELPGVTQFLIALSEATTDYGLWFVGFLVLSYVAYRQLMQSDTFRLKSHKVRLKIPVFGRVIKSINTSRFASTLSILTASAVPVLEGMRISGNVLENTYIKQLIKDAAAKVQGGSSLRASLEATKVFPPMMIHMIASGEKSGELQDMLARAAKNQEREFETQVNIALAIMGPVLILAMAGIVFFIVIAILLPIISLNNMI